jgi:hypothetical protein
VTQRQLLAAFLTAVIFAFLAPTLTPNATACQLDTGHLKGAVNYRAMPFGQKVRFEFGLYPATWCTDPSKLRTDAIPLAGPPGVQNLPVIPQPPDTDVTLLVAGIIFALFGLFVLWWGRDRASLWLGLFCSLLATPMFKPWGVFPAWAVLAGHALQSILSLVSLYALYALAETVACRGLDSDAVSSGIKVFRSIFIVALVLFFVDDLGDGLAPILLGSDFPATLDQFGTALGNFSIVVGFVGAPLALLGATALAGKNSLTRRNALIMFLTTLGGMGGVIYSICATVERANRAAGSSQFAAIAGFIAVPVALFAALVLLAREPLRRPARNAVGVIALAALGAAAYSLFRGYNSSLTLGFDSYWFWLLIIPVGFAIAIPTTQVVEVKIVITRVLAFSSMLVAVSLVLVTFEVLIKDATASVFGKEFTLQIATLLDIVAAFVIVLCFNTLERWSGEWVRRLIFRDEMQTVERLERFGKLSSLYSDPAKLRSDAVAEIAAALPTQRVAIFRKNGNDFSVMDARGAYPQILQANDAAAVSLCAGVSRLDLSGIAPTTTELPGDRFVFPITAAGQLVGALVVGPRVNEEQRAYVPEELSALDDLARKIGENLFRMRASQIVGFVDALASGRFSDGEARAQAQELRETGFLNKLM